MSMLRQTVEILQMQDDTQVDNDNVQGNQAEARGDAPPMEEAVSPLAGVAVVAVTSAPTAPDLLPTAA
jgi:hypothetical protein